MKIGVAGCIHETNTFAPGQTDISHFNKEWILDEADFLRRYEGTRTAWGGVVTGIRREEIDLEFLFYTKTSPSSIVSQDAAEHIVETLCHQVAENVSTFDGLVLNLHGAMVSEQWEDVEGEMLKRVRGIVGTKPIAVILDLHANISAEMTAYADFLIGYDTYPHIDAYERGEEAVRLLVQQINGEIKPYTCLKTCDMLIAPISMRTDSEPMKGLFEKAFEFEQEEGVLDVSIFGGFPYADVRMAGMSIVVVTDGDQEKAHLVADDLYQLAMQNSKKFMPELHPVDEACQIASSMKEAPVIFVESADNVGGGAPADATHVLKVLLEKRIERFLIFISDLLAVQKAFSMKENDMFSCKVGGKTDRKYHFPVIHGEPVLLEGSVQMLSDGEYVHIGKYMTGRKVSIGKTAVINVAGCPGSHVVLTENRVFPADPQLLNMLQMDPRDYRMIVVKSAIAWRTLFHFDPQHVVELDTAGCCSSNLTHFTFKNIPQRVKIIS